MMQLVLQRGRYFVESGDAHALQTLMNDETIANARPSTKVWCLALWHHRSPI